MSVVRFRPALPWLVTVLLAIVVLLSVTGWVLADGVNRGEALKTGGLAAGSIVALYALWLNDRRRRVDEERQEIEQRRHELENLRYTLENLRAEHDRERVADERFARAIELLGNPADQVRVGALHALAGLARSRPAYTQTVLDVLCSYLRRPFDHPMFAKLRGVEPEKFTPRNPHEEREKRREADKWRQVRLTAQRLIADLLPTVDTPDPPHYDLDLHGATLEYFDLSNRVIGQLRARLAKLYGSMSFRGTHIYGPAWFTEARCWGRLLAPGTVFHDRLWFSKFTAEGVVDFERAEFRGATKFTGATFGEGVSFRDAVFTGSVEGLPASD